MIKEEDIRKIADQHIENVQDGSYLVDVRVDSANKIAVELDAMEGSVSIDQCVALSRAIEGSLDRDEEDFALDVSSPGLDRPFKVPQQYHKNVGRDVKVKLIEGGKIEGMLQEVTDDGIIIKTVTKERLEGRKKKVKVEKEHKVSFDEINETKIVISFNKK